jgi:hypothetical protein
VNLDNSQKDLGSEGVKLFRKRIGQIYSRGIQLGYNESDIMETLDNAFRHYFTKYNGMDAPMTKGEMIELKNEDTQNEIKKRRRYT